MNLILTSVENELADAWERFCGDLDFVTVHRGSIFDFRATRWSVRPTVSGSWTAALTCFIRSISGGWCRSGCKRPFGSGIMGNCWSERRRSWRQTIPTCRFSSPRRPCGCRPFCATGEPVSGRAGGPAAGDARRVFPGSLRGGTRSPTTWTASPSPVWAQASGGSARTPAPVKSGPRLTAFCWGARYFPSPGPTRRLGIRAFTRTGCGICSTSRAG